MFWKKKNEESEKPKYIKVPTDSRQSYRISPAEDDPIEVFSGKKTFEVLDISSGGLSLFSEELKIEEELDIEFSLPIEMGTVKGRLKVLRRGQKGVFHCQFVDLPQEMEDKIHKYVLERQKEDLRF